MSSLEAAYKYPSAVERKRIVITTVGSRGDVQPYIVLALGLAQRGHDVAVATEARLKPLVQEFKVPFLQLEGDSTGLLFQPEAQAVLANGSFLKLMSLTKKWESQFKKADILASYAAACKGAHIIIASGLTMTPSLCCAQAEGAAWIPIILGPTYPTQEYPLWALKVVAISKCMNKWTYNAAFSALWGQEKKDINTWRKTQLGLQPLPDKGRGSFDVLVSAGSRLPVLIASSTLLCGPSRRVPADYPANVHVSGFLYAPEPKDEDIPQAARDFLSTQAPTDSRPVVYLGFGSMPAPDPSKLLQLAIDTCSLAGCRAILVAGWTALENDPKCKSLLAAPGMDRTLCLLKAVPHAWLFPRVSAIVHHCGVGTLASALKAGVPQVPCPFMLDQPHNSDVLLKLGVAPAVLPFKSKLTAPALATALRPILSDTSRAGSLWQAAKAAAEYVNKEHATTLDTFCTLIEKTLPLNQLV